MTSLLSGSRIIKLLDRDDRSTKEVNELAQNGIRTLSLRHLEAYLFDDEVIERLCEQQGLSDKLDECLNIKQQALQKLKDHRKQSDDVKSASGEIYVGLKRILDLKACGSNADAFMRDYIAPRITPDMEIYKKLERDIFGE